jgi:hypothetical protein
MITGGRLLWWSKPSGQMVVVNSVASSALQELLLRGTSKGVGGSHQHIQSYKLIHSLDQTLLLHSTQDLSQIEFVQDRNHSLLFCCVAMHHSNSSTSMYC